MADSAAFIATLGLKLEGFEQELKRANAIADRQLDSMERGFSIRNQSIGTAWGVAIGQGVERGVRIAIQAVRDFNEEMLDIGRISRFSGVDLNKVFALGEVLGGLKEAKSAIEAIATQFDEMSRGKKDVPLKELFDRNGVKNVRDSADALDHVLRIINSIGSEVGARQAGAKLGFSAEAVDRIRQAGSNLDAMRAAAEAAAPNLKKLQELAEQFDLAWSRAVQAIKANLIEAFSPTGEVRGKISEFIETTIRELRALEAVTEFIRNKFGVTGKTGVLGQGADKLEELLAEFRKIGSRPLGNPNRGTGSGLGLDDNNRLSALDREARRATERTALMAREAELVSATTEERARSLEHLRLEQMILRDNNTITEEQRKKIAGIADQYGLAVAQLERMRQAHQKSIELQNFAGNRLIDSLDRAAAGGAKLADIMADVAGAIRKAALQALILGQGPLAGFFGTMGQGGNPGGIFALLPKFQSGGVVPGHGPVPIIAHGGETIIPPKSVVHGGGGMTVNVMNQVGAQIQTSKRTGAAGRPVLDIRVMERMIVDTVQNSMASPNGQLNHLLGAMGGDRTRGMG